MTRTIRNTFNGFGWAILRVQLLNFVSIRPGNSDDGKNIHAIALSPTFLYSIFMDNGAVLGFRSSRSQFRFLRLSIQVRFHNLSGSMQGSKCSCTCHCVREDDFQGALVLSVGRSIHQSFRDGSGLRSDTKAAPRRSTPVDWMDGVAPTSPSLLPLREFLLDEDRKFHQKEVEGDASTRGKKKLHAHQPSEKDVL